MDNEENFWRILISQCRQEARQKDAGGTENSAIVRLANFLLLQAIEQQASDLHMEPYGEELRFRLRVNGWLTELPFRLPGSLAPMLISRFKVQGNMDIAKHQQPQDGSFIFAEQGHKVDVRAAVMPVAGGEMLTLRLLDLQEDLLRLGELGFTPDKETQFRKLLNRPAGLIIVCGPMNSGKSTTLYAALRELNTAARKWITLEDPIERHIPGINQVQINPKAGLTYASGLRAILRQDAQGILLGEIRDEETARIAIQAAETGHLVLSTLHTNSAKAAIDRLRDLGVLPEAIRESVLGIAAQRLLRKKSPGGYKGRIAAVELLRPDGTFVQGSLHEYADKLAERGITDEAEIRRVLG
jgi:general secretion pathway protein E/type IV pilus assembly protein PilB